MAAKIFFASVIIIICLTVYFYPKKNTLPPGESINLKATPTQSTIQQMQEISVDGIAYRFAHIIIKDNRSLNLFPNYEQKNDSDKLKADNKCHFLINGGFYDEEGQPIGWFLAQKVEVNKPSQNRLFNGYLYFKSGEIKIERFPQMSATWGLQTGPILIEKGDLSQLDLQSDKPARRMIAALDNKNQLIFIVVTSLQSLTSGPLLADLPQIISQININNNFNIVTAINLDGGMASAYISQEITIKEYTPIGSFFCAVE